MIKVSDYIVKKLEEYGIKHVFMISGGGAMHLNDSFGKSEKIRYVCNHHEQASSMSAEGYARAKGELSVVCVTSAPAGLNTVNGVFGNYTDSVPVLYISGQVKTETCMEYYGLKNLRQLGDQECDIINVVKDITKYTERVMHPDRIRYYLEKAIYLATTGRKGPVWLDIPLDIQSALIDENNLIGFTELGQSYADKERTEVELDCIRHFMSTKKRPLIVAGHGVRISDTVKELSNMLLNSNIPVVTTFNGMDVIPDSHPNYVGRIGTIGQRAGNFALQNADFVLFLGTRNNIRQTGYNYKDFAKNACTMAVDIDDSELRKPTFRAGGIINRDLKEFMPILQNSIADVVTDKNWLDWCIERKNKYGPDVNIDYKQNGDRPINPYFFVRELTKAMSDDDIIVSGNGTASVALFQAGIIKENTRVIMNSGCASMGYDLPSAIGACLANNKKQVICLTGDGSIMMNLQELQTIRYHNLPIKIFVLNNNGYSSIKQTQDNFFEGRRTASSPISGVKMPDFVKVGSAFNITSSMLYVPEDIGVIKQILELEIPYICEVIVDQNAKFTPKVSSEKLEDGTIISKDLSDMYPFLTRGEYYSNII